MSSLLSLHEATLTSVTHPLLLVTFIKLCIKIHEWGKNETNFDGKLIFVRVRYGV